MKTWLDMEYRGLKGSVCYSLEDGCWYGKILDIEPHTWLYEGEDTLELTLEFHYAVDEYLEEIEVDYDQN